MKARLHLWIAGAALLTTVAFTVAPVARVSAQAVTSAVLFVGTPSSPTAVAATSGQVHVLVKDAIPGVAATNLGKAEDGGHTTGDVGVFALGVIDSTNATQRAATLDYAQITVDHYGTLLARSDHPNRIHCVVAVSTATTITAVGGSCAAPGASLSLYVTDISFGTSAAAGTAADSFPTIKSGTGGTCGAATAVIWQGLTTANSTLVDNRTIPIKVTANNELCWIMTTAGSKTLQISGFIAP